MYIIGRWIVRWANHQDWYPSPGDGEVKGKGKEGKDGKIGKVEKPKKGGGPLRKAEGQGRGQGKTAETTKGAETQGSTAGETGPTQALVSEVTSLLKSMRVAQSGTQSGARPSISAVRLNKVEVGKESTVLLDGGATNCLRRATSWKEHEEAHPAHVNLASGTVLMRQHQQTGTGTLLVMDEVQPIVPICRPGQNRRRSTVDSNRLRNEESRKIIASFLRRWLPCHREKGRNELLSEVEEF